MASAYRQIPATCAARGCRVHIERGMLMCKPHWNSLPPMLRRSILITHRERLGRDHIELVDQARDIIARDAARRCDTIAYRPDGTAVAFIGWRL